MELALEEMPYDVLWVFDPFVCSGRKVYKMVSAESQELHFLPGHKNYFRRGSSLEIENRDVIYWESEVEVFYFGENGE
jgi:hypothetical protein